DDGEAVFALGEVAGDGERAHTRLLHPRDGLVGILVLVVVRDGDVRALARVRDRDGATDAAVASRDQRDAAFQLARAAVAVLAVIRAGRHGVRTTRPLLLLSRRSTLEGAVGARIRFLLQPLATAGSAPS